MTKREFLKNAALGSATLLAGSALASCTNAVAAKKELKAYDNSHFYENGKLSAKKTLDAYIEMFNYYNYPVNDFLLENMFISDFNLGDFANCGMAGIFWYNDEKNSYFAHEIYLLPGQMIAEHSHVATKYKPKMETWHVRYGSIFNFGEGETTPNNPKTPESQKDFITVSNVNKLELNGIQTLGREESPHFMMAGKKGAIVSEYATYHDNDGLRFTNPNVVFKNVLDQLK
jgi:D-lyxose ketol-isomerase